MNDDRRLPQIEHAHVDRMPIHQTLLTHFRRMPGWHRQVLIVAMVLSALGAIGLARRTVMPTPVAMKGTPAPSIESTSSRDGFVSDAPPAEAVKPQQTVSTQPWYFSPRFLAIGGSTIGGFVIGWAMRAFVKTVTLALAAVGGLIGTLSYFRFFNVDFSAAHQEFATAAAWFNSQIGLLRDSAIAHLPSHMGAAFGALIGFRRR